MLRTRDFLSFSVITSFLLFGIGMTWMSGLAEESDSTATVLVAFPEGQIPDGAVAADQTIDQDATIARLRDKVASGVGDISAGGPNFDSVDDLRAVTDTDVVTDQTLPDSVLIGHTMDGLPLMSDDSWRFMGWQAHQQIGVALDGVPIYGTRIDSTPLDECGGFDDGAGYSYYMRGGQDFTIGCLDQNNL